MLGYYYGLLQSSRVELEAFAQRRTCPWIELLEELLQHRRPKSSITTRPYYSPLASSPKRLGRLLTRVETIEQTLTLEIAGYLVEYEFRVSNSLDAAYEDVVAIDPVAAQPVELIQLMRPTLRAGN